MVKNFNWVKSEKSELNKLKRQEDIVYFAHNLIKTFKNNNLDKSISKFPSLTESLRMLKEIREKIKRKELDVRIAILAQQQYYIYMSDINCATIEHPGTKAQFIRGKNCFKRAIEKAEQQLKLNKSQD